MKIRYVGQFDAVIVPELGREVARGEVVELTSAPEVALGERLLDAGGALDGDTLVRGHGEWAPADADEAPSEPAAETGKRRPR